jgi:hypothetical protein
MNEFVAFYFCCDDGSSDGRDVQAESTEGWSSRDMWADFLYVVCGSIFKNSLLSNIYFYFICKHVGLIFIFQAILVSGYICPA